MWEVQAHKWRGAKVGVIPRKAEIFKRETCTTSADETQWITISAEDVRAGFGRHKVSQTPPDENRCGRCLEAPNRPCRGGGPAGDQTNGETELEGFSPSSNLIFSNGTPCEKRFGEAKLGIKPHRRLASGFPSVLIKEKTFPDLAHAGGALEMNHALSRGRKPVTWWCSSGVEGESAQIPWVHHLQI
ncbi:hypothetical protein BGW80DRAFT_1251588 [Lactifluus volemus]|nr:hypothetical protein BGW80DRAFT_1251588 [Lactifluus volemus]